MLIAVGECRQHLRRLLHQRSGEIAFRTRVERHVEKHERQARPADRPRTAGFRGQTEQPCPIAQPGVFDLRFDARQKLPNVSQRAPVGPADTGRLGPASQALGPDTGETQLVQRPPERARKSRGRRDRGEVREFVRGKRLEDRTRRYRLSRLSPSPELADRSSGDASSPRGKLREAESGDAEGRSRLARDVAARDRRPHRVRRRR